MLPLRTRLHKSLGLAGSLALLALAVPGCISPPEYPDTPEIEFRDIKVRRVEDSRGAFDNVTVVIGYRDGDGNLGEGASGPNNYFCQLQVQQPGGAFVDFNGVTFDGRFPNLTPPSQEDRKAPIRGDISYDFRLSFNTALGPGDVLRYRISIQDRALNRSNEVVTSPITLLE